MKWERGASGLVAFVDSDFAGDLSGQVYLSGFVFLTGGPAIAWGSKLQTIAALSTVETELIAELI